MHKSSANEGGNDGSSCRSNLEEAIGNLERANNGMSELCNNFTVIKSERNSSCEGKDEQKKIALSIDEGSGSTFSAYPPGKTSEQAEHEGQTEHVEHVVSQPRIGINQRRLNLAYFIWLKLIYAYDSGAFSAAVGFSNGIVDQWKLSTTQQGALISSVFLGNVFGCLLSAHLFSTYDQKKVLVLSLIYHTAATFLFTLLPFFYLALVTRFLLGITLSFVVVYVPVWVEEFAPKGRESIWMGSHLVAVPVGIILGYLVCAYFTLNVQIGWEYSFYIKCLFMLPTILCLSQINPQFINTGQASTRNSEPGKAKFMLTDVPEPSPAETNSEDTAAQPSHYERIQKYICQRTNIIFKVVRPLLCNVVFMINVFIMCMMFFIATGLQNFLTQYLLEDPFNASMTTITVGFGISVLMAPVLGVIVGGIALDLCGGYSDDLLRVGIFGLCWSIPGSIFSTACIFMTDSVPFIVLVALMLFCGGAIIPFATGLTMCSLPEHFRPAGAAFSQIVYNLLGSFSGPIVCSVVADVAGGLKYGIMTLLLSTNIGIILMAILFLIAIKTRNCNNSTPLEVVIIGNTNDASQKTAFNPSNSKGQTEAHCNIGKRVPREPKFNTLCQQRKPRVQPKNIDLLDITGQGK